MFLFPKVLVLGYIMTAYCDVTAQQGVRLGQEIWVTRKRDRKTERSLHVSNMSLTGNFMR